MTKYALPLALLGMLLTASCRHRAVTEQQPHAHEEATPVSDLPHHEFSQVTPQRGRH